MLRLLDSFISINSPNNHERCYFQVIQVRKLTLELSKSISQFNQLVSVSADQYSNPDVPDSQLEFFTTTPSDGPKGKAVSVTRLRILDLLTTEGQSRGCKTRYRLGQDPGGLVFHIIHNWSFISITVLTTLSICSSFFPWNTDLEYKIEIFRAAEY